MSLSLIEHDDGVADFIVENRSALDVRSVTFTVRYEVEGQEALSVDTIRYSRAHDVSGAEVPFVAGRGSTFFSHALPSNASNPSASAVAVEYRDGSSWSGN